MRHDWAMSENVGNYENNKNLIPLYTEGDLNAYLYDEVNPVARKIRYFGAERVIVNDKFVFDIDFISTSENRSEISMVASDYSACHIESGIIEENGDGYQFVAEDRIRIGTKPEGLGVAPINREYAQKFFDDNSVTGAVVFSYPDKSKNGSDSWRKYRNGFAKNDGILLRLIVENPYGVDVLLDTKDIKAVQNSAFYNWSFTLLTSSTASGSFGLHEISVILSGEYVTIPKKSELAIDVGIADLSSASSLTDEHYVSIIHSSNIRGFFVSD